VKLIYKGKYKSEDQLPKGNLPTNAVMFREPETAGKLNLVASLFALPALLLIGLIVLGSVLLHGSINLQRSSLADYAGVLLAFLTLLPHEFLHAVWFGRESEVELFIAPEKLMLFVICTQPVTKVRFILLSLFPNLVFGWFPLLLWAILPYGVILSNVLFYFSVISILFGVGDYLNVYNAIRQMPKGSMQQLSGFHSYWFVP